MKMRSPGFFNKVDNGSHRHGFYCRLLVLPFMTTMVFTPSTPASGPLYEDIAPILAGRCVICHTGPSAPLALELDTLAGVLKGSRNGPVVVAGDPPGSELIKRLKGISQPRMPMTGPPYLSNEEIRLFEEWIAGGLPAGNGGGQPDKQPVVETERMQPGGQVTYLQVAPVLARRCAKCHTQGGLMGDAPEGYHLTSYGSTLSSRDRVRVVPGDPDASELVRRIRGQARPRMPFDGPPYLTDEEIGLIEAWVSQGARDSAGREAGVPAGARVRLHGELTGRWRLDGLPLTVTGRTRIDKAPRLGDYVQVRGRLGADGEVIADRIRRR